MRLIAVLLAVVSMLVLLSENAFARGGFRGGGFRMSGSYRSLGGFRSSRGASGSFFRWGSSTRSASSTAFGRSRSTASTAGVIGGSRASVATQRSLYTTAQQRGTVFASRQEAAQSFSTRYANQYSSRFSSRPTTRPSYIPQTTTVGGRSVNIVYDPRMGGYGYMDPALGHWVFFNALANAAILNGLMVNHGYWWGAPPAYYGGFNFFGTALILFFIFIAISGLLRFLRGARRDW
ncbi:MAG TPA: hypothetical protein VMW69_13040 [Spirochaetia bacterium]|nr:hypothetical protein [Spirochaetia bacterium]